MKISDVFQARENLKDAVHVTPLDFSTTFSNMTGAQVYLKLENLQKTGSFKIRGAYNKIALLTPEEKKLGVIAASAGNHAQGVAYAAQQAGIKSCIVMPQTAPLSKITATRGYGAEVILAGQVYDDAFQKALEIKENTGATFIHAFNDRDVIAGQGTIGLEILEQIDGLDVVFVPVGGGGLASGIAFTLKSLKPKIKVIGVESEGAACLQTSLRQGERCTLTSARTIADGIAVKCPGDITYDILKEIIDDVVTVNDEEIASTILLLLERAKLVVEGAGAVALAALIYGNYDLAKKKAVAVISGGNIDVNTVSRIIEKGLVKTGRLIRLVTSIKDKPGNLQSFLHVIAAAQANVISINHDRARVDLPLDQAEVEVVLETQSSEHAQIIIKSLEGQGFYIKTI